MFKTFSLGSNGPIPQAVLFWSGTLLSEAIGFCAAFARPSPSAGFACSAGAGFSCADANMTGKKRMDSNESNFSFNHFKVLARSALEAFLAALMSQLNAFSTHTNGSQYVRTGPIRGVFTGAATP